MAIKVGINGFGRIGRVVFRVLMQEMNLNFVVSTCVMQNWIIWHIS